MSAGKLSDDVVIFVTYTAQFLFEVGWGTAEA